MGITNFKLISKGNLCHNLSKVDNKIILMVKANAYGHGIKEIVEISKDYVAGFGVVSLEEALFLRKITKKRVIIFSPIFDYATCKRKRLEFFVENEKGLKEAYQAGCKNLIHLAINVGMNRYGTKSVVELGLMNTFLEEHKIKLKSIYTHFPMTNNRRRTAREYEKFLKLKAFITQNPPISFGGSSIRNYDFDFDYIRLGIDAYGYGKDMRKVMKVTSKVVKVLYIRKGEYVGYGKKYKEKAGGFVAIFPLGYGDGLTRKLSGHFKVIINGIKYRSIGNICMDCAFVKVDSNVRVGDLVEVMNDAEYFARKTKTIPYEILTNFSLLRGVTKIVD